MRFVRFQGGGVSRVTNKERGIFAASWHLRRTSKVSEQDGERIDEIIQWFEKNLKNPDHYNGSNPERVVSYFKESAVEMIRLMREWAGILNRYGLEIQVIETDNPAGVIVYEDDFQIVVK